MSSFIKQRADAPAAFFEAEAAGLAWLSRAQAGVRVASVIRTEPGLIELDRIPEVRPTIDAASAFGAALAHTHAAGALAFGARPDGWAGPLFIGSREMPAANETSWGAFYARNRVLPFLEVALTVGNVAPAHDDEIRAACELVASGAFDDADAPSRIHGDLWAGNVLWSPDGVVLIDPAAHGGHRETDLAMLALFGCPYLDEVIAGYETVSPLRAGWRDRVGLHQLHPLAVHAAGHGPGYGVALWRAAQSVLNL